MSASPVRLGVVGCGHATAALHLPALRGVQEVEVVAVTDLDGTRASAVASTFQVPACDDLDAVLAVDLDAVAVCVPPADHARVALSVLASGRHLFLEKPPAVTLEELDEVIEAASEPGVVALVGFNLRHHTNVIAARTIVESGVLGAIEVVRSTFTSGLRSAAGLPSWRTGDQLEVAIVDVGIHHIDLWRHLLGVEIDEIRASAATGDPGGQSAAVIATLSSGAVAVGGFSQASAEQNEIEIVGRSGRLVVSMYRFDGVELTGAGVIPGDVRERARGVLRTGRALPSGVAAMRRGGVVLDSYAQGWRHFARCIRDGEAPASTLTDARVSLDAALRAVASARSSVPATA